MDLQLINVDGIAEFLNAYFVTLKEVLDLWNNHPWMLKPLGEGLVGTS